MPHYLIRWNRDDREQYVVWSTIGDAPITYGMTLDELHELVRDEHGEAGMRELPARLDRCAKKGTSAVGKSRADVIRGNRAGLNETELTEDQIYEWCCVTRTPEPPMGKPRKMHRDDEDL